MRTLTRGEWLTRGRELYGADMRDWKFRCVACGHVQSHNLAKERRPDIGDTSSWIYFSCEGRHNPAVGCDWTLGGLFQIHELEVVKEDGGRSPCFEFADDPPSASKPFVGPREDPVRLRATDYDQLKSMSRLKDGDRALVYATTEIWKFDKASDAPPDGQTVLRARRRGRWLLEARS